MTLPAVTTPTRIAARAVLPVLVAAAGERASARFLEFFTARIRNPHTRRAYGRAVGDFLAWCEERGVRSIAAVQPLHVAALIELQTREPSQHLRTAKLARLHLQSHLSPVPIVRRQAIRLGPACKVLSIESAERCRTTRPKHTRVWHTFDCHPNTLDGQLRVQSCRPRRSREINARIEAHQTVPRQLPSFTGLPPCFLSGGGGLAAARFSCSRAHSVAVISP